MYEIHTHGLHILMPVIQSAADLFCLKNMYGFPKDIVFDSRIPVAGHCVSAELLF